jgi:hypothetical protein
METKRYEVIPSKVLVRDDGATASPYGACPWTSEAERARWSAKDVGWTVRDNRTGTVGVGRRPWTDRAEADSWADARNAPKVAPPAA